MSKFKPTGAAADFVAVVRKCGRDVTIERAEKKGVGKQFARARRAGYFQQTKVFRPSWKATELLWLLIDRGAQ